MNALNTTSAPRYSTIDELLADFSDTLPATIDDNAADDDAADDENVMPRHIFCEKLEKLNSLLADAYKIADELAEADYRTPVTEYDRQDARDNFDALLAMRRAINDCLCDIYEIHDRTDYM